MLFGDFQSFFCIIVHIAFIYFFLYKRQALKLMNYLKHKYINRNYKKENFIGKAHQSFKDFVSTWVCLYFYEMITLNL